MTQVPRSFWRKPQPVIGILLVVAGWAVSHQAGSDGVFDACIHRGGGYVVVVSLLGLLVTAAGGAYGLIAGRASVELGRRFFGYVTALLGVLTAFSIVLQIMAGLILPRCLG
jgi:hypothetical protein